MTTTSPARVPAPVSGHPVLRRLCTVTPEEFAARYWGRDALLSRADDLPHDFTDLFRADSVDELVSTRGLRAPFLRMAKDGTTLPDASFTSGGGVGAGIPDQADDGAVLRHFAEGATLVLQGLHRVWAPLITFSQLLAADLGHPNQVNAYITPPASTGFNDHYDVHDVFVLHIAGEKRWRVRRPVHESPLRDQPWTDRRSAVERAAQEPPQLEETLHPGDCLYLPRGFLHSATALGATSIHLTIGVHVWNRAHLAEAVLRAATTGATQDAELRASLPLGIDLADLATLAPDVELVRAALHRALDQLGPDDLLAHLLAGQRAAQRPAPLGPLGQALAAAALTPQTTLRLRDHLAASLDHQGSGWVLRSRAGAVPLDDDERARVAHLLATGAASAGELGTETARRLVLAGVLVPG